MKIKLIQLCLNVNRCAKTLLQKKVGLVEFSFITQPTSKWEPSQQRSIITRVGEAVPCMVTKGAGSGTRGPNSGHMGTT